MQARARPLGAWLVGVGLHPLALVPYELVQDRASKTRTLFALGASVLIAERLLTQAVIAVPWLLTMTVHALITAWWVRRAYVQTSGNRPAFHPLGLLAALATGLPILVLQHLHL